MQTVDFKALRVFAEEIRVASLKEFKALGLSLIHIWTGRRRTFCLRRRACGDRPSI